MRVHSSCRLLSRHPPTTAYSIILPTQIIMVWLSYFPPVTVFPPSTTCSDHELAELFCSGGSCLVGNVWHGQGMDSDIVSTLLGNLGQACEGRCGSVTLFTSPLQDFRKRILQLTDWTKENGSHTIHHSKVSFLICNGKWSPALNLLILVSHLHMSASPLRSR